MARRWQYPSCIEPILDEAQRPEEVLPDKYWQQPSEPLHTAPRSEAALYASGVLVEFGVPVPPVPEIGWLILAPEPLHRPPTPIQSLPELVPGAGALPEFITLDRWWREADNPLPAPPSSYYYPWADYRVELALEEVAVDKWWRQPSEPQRQPPLPWLEPATELVLDELQRPETVTVDRWWREADNPLPAPPSSYYYSWAEYRSELGLEVITLDKWWRPPSLPQWRAPPPWLEPATELVLDEAQRPEAVSIDRYWQQPSEPLRALPRSAAALYASGILVEFGIPTPPIPEIGWLILAPDPVPRLPTIPEPPPELILDEAQRPEAVSVDKWWAQSPVPSRLRPFPEMGLMALSEFGAPPEVIYLDKWYRPASEPTRRWPAPPQPMATELTLDEAQRPEAVSLDKWWRESDNPLPAPPSPYYYPWVDYQVLRPEIITLDKWWREADNPLPKPPSPYYYPWVSYHVLGPEVITLDKWWVEYFNPILLPPRAQGFFFLPLLEVAAPPYVAIPFAFDECLFLWEVIHPSSWESAVIPSGYMAGAPYVPPPSGYREPIEVSIPSGYVRKADGRTLWDL